MKRKTIKVNGEEINTQMKYEPAEEVTYRNTQFAEVSTMVDDKVYNRMTHIKENIHEYLRNEIRKQLTDPDWSTEEIFTIFKKGSKRCEDRTKVIMKVQSL